MQRRFRRDQFGDVHGHARLTIHGNDISAGPGLFPIPRASHPPNLICAMRKVWQKIFSMPSAGAQMIIYPSN
jgi:hypothetical protein